MLFPFFHENSQKNVTYEKNGSLFSRGYPVCNQNVVIFLSRSMGIVTLSFFLFPPDGCRPLEHFGSIGKTPVLDTGKKQGQQSFKDLLRDSRSDEVASAYGKICCMDRHGTGHSKKLIRKMACQRLTFCRSRCGCHIGKAKIPQFPKSFLQVLGTAEGPAAGFLPKPAPKCRIRQEPTRTKMHMVSYEKSHTVH